MTYMHSIVIISTFVSILFADSNQRLGLQVIKHAPCSTSPSGSRDWHPSIKFGSSKTTPFVADPNQPGCYSMSGEVVVNKSIRDRLQIYVEVRTGPDSTVAPEQCSGMNKWTGCGGFGSCAYCENCESLSKKEAAIAKLTLTKNGLPFDCEERTLEPGVYKDITMSFCMPTEREFLKHSDIDRETWEAIRATQGDMVPTFLNIYTFEQRRGSIARAVAAQQTLIDTRMRQRDNRLESEYRRQLYDTRHKSEDEQPSEPILGVPLRLSMEDLYDMPVARLLRQDEHIACHRVYAQMYFDNKDVPRDSRARSAIRHDALRRSSSAANHNIFKNQNRE